MKTTIKIRIKKPWELAKGHSDRRSGAGMHDSRPKRKRTRQTQRSAWQKEFSN